MDDKMIASAFPVKHTVKEFSIKMEENKQKNNSALPVKVTANIKTFSGDKYVLETRFFVDDKKNGLFIDVVLLTDIVGSGAFTTVRDLIHKTVVPMAVSEIEGVIARCSRAMGNPLYIDRN